MAVLTQLARVSVEQPDKYPVPWLALYPLSVAVLLGFGAKKILGPPRKPEGAPQAGGAEATAKGGEHARATPSTIDALTAAPATETTSAAHMKVA